MRDTNTPSTLPEIPVELLDQLLSGVDAKTAYSNGGLLDALKKAMAERVLNAEMDHPDACTARPSCHPSRPGRHAARWRRRCVKRTCRDLDRADIGFVRLARGSPEPCS